jgi:hypothetical protein
MSDNKLVEGMDGVNLDGKDDGPVEVRLNTNDSITVLFVSMVVFSLGCSCF